MDTRLIEYMNEMVRNTPTEFQRYMYNKINWDARLVGIVGPRGVGKSTMLLQHLIISGKENALFVTADNLYFSSHSLIELADEFVKNNGKKLFIDEIHKYNGWSSELKFIYDVHPTLQIFFTGSSILDIKRGQADLSRRVLLYQMQGLSFREYLEMFHAIKCDVFSLEEILAHKAAIPGLDHPLPYFRKYLSEGYYPFAIEGDLYMRLEQVVNQTIEVDIPQYVDMKASTIKKLKKLLAIVSRLVPYKPSTTGLAAEIGVSKNNVSDYLAYLEATGLLAMLHDETVGLNGLKKVEKLYLDNTSLMNALGKSGINKGNERETFFFNQMRVNHIVTSSKISDFKIDHITFEVGGKSKDSKQLQGAAHGIVVKDDIEVGYGNVVPLWQFGLNY